MIRYFEAHITILGDPLIIKEAVQSIEWSFSKIDSDIVLGSGVKCYATNHFSPQKFLEQEIKEILIEKAKHLRSLGLNVVRSKIEAVLYDKLYRN